MTYSMVSDTIRKYPKMTDEEIHQHLRKHFAVSMSDIAKVRREYSDYLANRTKSQRKEDTRSICKHTGDYHKTGMWTPYKKDNNLWACKDCGRVRRRFSDKSERWLSMKASKPLVKAIDKIQNTYIVTVEMKRTIKYLADIEVKASSEDQARTVANMHYHGFTDSDTKELSRKQDGEPRESTPNNPENYWKTILKETS